MERWGEQTGMKKRSEEIERVIHLAGGSGEIRKWRMGKAGRSGSDRSEKMRRRLRWGGRERRRKYCKRCDYKKNNLVQ